MIIPLIALAIILLASIVAAEEPTIYSNAKDFYYCLSAKRQREILHSVDLEDPNQLNALQQLLTNATFDIAGIYNAGCQLISEDRATKILEIVREQKELEKLLLGPACLSQSIIEARKLCHMWPPRDFPLLVDGLRLKDIPIDDVRDILDEALKQPQWWYSGVWVNDIMWSKMNDLRFWRMIPINLYTFKHQEIYLYQKRALLATINDQSHQAVEELLMKLIRVIYFMGSHEEALEEEAFLCAENGFLVQLSHLNDPWCERVRNVVMRLCVGSLIKAVLVRALLKEELLDMNTWLSPLDRGAFDEATVMSDIFELLIVSTKLTKSFSLMEKIRGLLKDALQNVRDYSNVRPVTAKEFGLLAN